MIKAQITPAVRARPEGIKCAPTEARWKEVRLQERPPSGADKRSWRERLPAESWRALAEGSVGVQGGSCFQSGVSRCGVLTRLLFYGLLQRYVLDGPRMPRTEGSSLGPLFTA